MARPTAKTRTDPAEPAREWLAAARRRGGDRARREDLRARVLAAGDRLEPPPAGLSSDPGPGIEAARWFEDPADMARAYRASARDGSLILRCRRPLPAGSWITFAFQAAAQPRLEVVVIAAGAGAMEVQPFQPRGGGVEAFLDAVATATAERILAPAPGAVGRKRR